MKKILIIDAIGKDDKSSRTKILAEAVISKIDETQYEIEYLDLTKENIPFIDREVVEARKSQEYTSNKQKEALKYLNQFEAADKYIFIYQTWNWSVPANMKAYVDLIMVSGHNFTYKGLKIVGLLENKSVILINTTGGPILGAKIGGLTNNLNGNIYMKKIVKILGIKNVDVYAIGAMSYGFKNKEKNISFDIDKYQEKVNKITKNIII